MPRLTRPLRYAILPAALALALSAPTRAEPQFEPQALPEPEMQRRPEARFHLQGVRFRGATVFGEQTLQTFAADLVGREVGMADLEDLANRITQAYRDRGYFLSRAVIPVQEVRGGVVEITVVEGQVGEVRVGVAEGTPVSEERIQRMLSALEPNAPLDGRAYERGMLLVSDLPGVRAQSVVQPGRDPSATDIEVRVEPGRRTMWTLEADNHGTRESGRHRVGGSLRWASPFGIGDNLDLRLLVAEDANTLFGRLSYEAPLGYRGTRIGAGLARVQYELGGAVAVLEPTGTADIVDVSLTHPVIRQRGTNLLLRLSADHKKLKDEFEAVGFVSRKRVQGLGLGWAFEHRDRWGGGGYTSVNGVLYRGDLDIRDANNRALDQSVFGRNTHGSFTKLTLQATRLQRIGGPVNLFVGVGAQQTNRNLDPSEQLSLGGPRAVRAYPTGELLVDEGFIVNVEWRWALNEDVTAFYLWDIARGRSNHDPGPFLDNRTHSLRGSGLGLAWSAPYDIGMNLTVAWADTGRSRGSDHRDPRLFWQVQKRF